MEKIREKVSGHKGERRGLDEEIKEREGNRWWAA
jgi:hypothetical protein